MIKKIFIILILFVLVLSVVGCKPIDNISYTDNAKIIISWPECHLGRAGSILTNTFDENDGVIYVDNYYAWYGSIKGWVHQDGSIIIRSPSVIIRYLTKED